jgi:hypothetical protein
MSITSQHPLFPTSSTHVTSNANNLGQQWRNICVPTRLQTSDGLPIPIALPMVFPLLTHGPAPSLLVLVPTLHNDGSSIKSSTRNESLATVVWCIATVKITFCFFLCWSGPFVQRSFGKITTLAFTIALTQLTRSSSVWISKQERNLELRLSRLHFKSCLHQRLRPQEAPQTSHQVFLLPSL